MNVYRPGFFQFVSILFVDKNSRVTKCSAIGSRFVGKNYQIVYNTRKSLVNDSQTKQRDF